MSAPAGEAFSAELQALLGGRYPYLWIETHEERRALDEVARAARGCERAFGCWSSLTGLVADEGSLQQESDTTSLPAALAELYRLRRCVVAVLDPHPYLDDPRLVRSLREMMRHLDTAEVTLVMISHRAQVPRELERDVVVLTLPLPGPALLTKVAHEVLGPAEAGTAEELARAAQGLTAEESRRAYRRAQQLRSSSESPTSLEDLVRWVSEEKRRLVRRSDVLEFVNPDEGSSEIGGLESLKGWIEHRRATFGREAQDFGLPAPRGLFLLGVQGCGKSLTAKAVAGEFALPLIRLDLGAVFSQSSVGPEENLRAAMRLSEAMAPVVLWIDEIEKGFSGVAASVLDDRGEARAAGASDPQGTRAFGAFLTWLQEKSLPVFVVATANDVTSLPPELLRKGRFDEIFFIDLPAKPERREILRIHIDKRGRDPSQFDLDELADAADNFTGAELEQLVVGALYRAFAEQRELSQADLLGELKATVPLYSTYEEQIRGLRQWAQRRARRASADDRLARLFNR